MTETSIPAASIPTAAAAAAFTPAPEIVAELQATSLPREAKAALAALTSELGPVWRYSWSPFRCLFGFKQWTGSLAAFPDWPGATVDGAPTHAAGPWQAEPATYREIALLTGNAGFFPPDQIGNMWVLGVRDFGRRSPPGAGPHGAKAGGDLLTALKAGQFAEVSTALIATWPAGADQGFGERYTAALALFADTTTPPPTTPPPVTAPSGPITLRLGTQVSFPIAGTDQDGQPITPAPDALVSDDPQICTARIATPADVGLQPTGLTGGAVATIATVGLGQTLVRGADLAITITVEAARLAHLTANLKKAVVARIPTALMAPMGAAMVALGLLLTPAIHPENPDFGALNPVLTAVQPAPTSLFSPSNEAAKSNTALSNAPINPTRRIDREPSVPVIGSQRSKASPAASPNRVRTIGDPDFCLASGSLVALERCVTWTAALSPRR